MSSNQRTIAIQRVHMTLSGARHRGLDISALLQRAHIAPALMESPLARVSQAQYGRLLRELRHVMRDELWGLTSQPLRPGTYGQCLLQMVRCATLGEALRRSFVFYRFVLPDFRPRLLVGEHQARLRFELVHPSNELLEEAVKVFQWITHATASWLVARRIPLRHVEYKVGGSGLDTSRVYQAPVHYGQDHVGLSFDAHWLDLPVVQSARSLQEFLAGAPENLVVSYRDTSSLTDRVRRLLRKQLAQELPPLDVVARELAVTAQTLRRRLKDEGRGYQQIKDEIRRDAAVEYLVQTRLSLPEIAGRVGFSEASTFHRAFKSWTGLAPGEYRNSHTSGMQ